MFLPNEENLKVDSDNKTLNKTHIFYFILGCGMLGVLGTYLGFKDQIDGWFPESKGSVGPHLNDVQSLDMHWSEEEASGPVMSGENFTSDTAFIAYGCVVALMMIAGAAYWYNKRQNSATESSVRISQTVTAESNAANPTPGANS